MRNNSLTDKEFVKCRDANFPDWDYDNAGNTVVLSFRWDAYIDKSTNFSSKINKWAAGKFFTYNYTINFTAHTIIYFQYRKDAQEFLRKYTINHIITKRGFGQIESEPSALVLWLDRQGEL